MKYAEYVDRVLALLDKTQVPETFKMLHALVGNTDEDHAQLEEQNARILNLIMSSAYSHEISVEETSLVIETAILEAFAELFVNNERKN